jgi:hypothetical protein
MNPFRAWRAFWFAPISARPLGLFRIVIGVCMIYQLALLSVDLDFWFTDQGVLQGTEARELAGPWRPSPLQYIQDPLSVRAFFVATVAVAVLFTIGWRTRLVSCLLFFMNLSIHHRNIPTNCGPDNLLLLMLFYLMLAPSGAAYSLDARRRARRRDAPAEPLIVPWAQRLIQLQLCLIYFDTAVLKCNGSTWLGGTAMHFVFQNHEVGRLDWSWFCQYPLLISVMTHVALFTEFLLAVLLWFKPTRPWMIAAGLLLHGGILLVINVPIFGEVMTACYLTFMTPAELDSVACALNLRRWFRRAGRRSDSPRYQRRVDPPHSLAGSHVAARAEDGAEVSA